MMGRCVGFLLPFLASIITSDASVSTLGESAQSVVLQQDVTIDSGFIVIRAQTRSPVQVQRAWQVLTDFDGLDRFLPSMDSSIGVDR